MILAVMDGPLDGAKGISGGALKCIENLRSERTSTVRAPMLV